jgi:hypothetical protein
VRTEGPIGAGIGVAAGQMAALAVHTQVPLMVPKLDVGSGFLIE